MRGTEPGSRVRRRSDRVGDDGCPRHGSTRSVVLRYADSGDVSGDKSAVVGYLAAALGTFDPVAA